MAEETILIRVRALIERAAHEATPEEEARSSAVIACKLIHKHALLTTPVSSAPTFSADDFTRSYSTPSPSQRSTKKAKGRSRPWVDPTYEEDPDVVKLVSKFRGRCLSCLKAYEVGETIWWQKGVGVTHESCKDYWEDV